MGTIGKERKVIMASIFLVFLGLVTAIINDRTDHIYRTAVAIAGLSVPLSLPAKVPDPPERLRPFLAPIYNEGTMMILAVFIAVHVSLVNVPFTHYDPFHRDWRNADIISHFLGGLTLWLIITEALVELSERWERFSREELVVYSFVVFYALAVGWEVAEKLSEGSITFIHETATNKLRDLVMDTLGALFGLWMLRRKNYPFSLPRE